MTKRSSRRREAIPSEAWYRTLLRSYLYRPPLWVYLVELAVATVVILTIIFGGDEHVISLLTQVLWGP